MDKKIILLVAALASSLLVRAQDMRGLELQAEADPPSWFVRTFRSLTGPSAKLDTAYVFQTPLRWSVAPDYTLISSTVDLHSDVTEAPLPGSDRPSGSYGMDFNVRKHLYHKVGVSAGYGGMILGYGVEVGDKRQNRNTYFNLGLSGSAYGLQVQNYVINDYLEKAGGPSGRSAVSAYPGRLRDFAVDAYYVFNNRRFVYASAYRGAKLQRRSAGSWMLSGRYLQGDMAVDERDAQFLEITDRLGRFGTQQVSVGGGYSFNWVLRHRDPSGEAGVKGLRNLTLNLTALPMASLYTNVESFVYPEGGDPYRTRFDGQFAVTFQAHAALCYCWDRYCLNVQVHHNRFGFHGAAQTLVDRERGLQYTVNTRALFQDLTGKVQFYVRF